MKKLKKKMYFDDTVQNSIVEYNKLTSQKEKNIVYELNIYPAFCKLAENLINMGKYMYIDLPYEDLHCQVVSMLTIKMHRYNEERAKAYSFFTRIAINYLIMENKKGYKNRVGEAELWEIDEERDIINEVVTKHYKDSLDDFMNLWTGELYEKLRCTFKNNLDKAIADSIIDIFKHRKSLYAFNKKALYVLIRERSNIPMTNTNRITKIVKIFKDDFDLQFNKYMKK